MKMKSLLAILALAISAVTGAAATTWAQSPTATVHGKIVNPAGQPIKTGEVKFTSDKTSAPKDRVYKYSAPINPDGTYTVKDLPANDYLAVVFDGPKSIDFQPVTVKAGEDKTLDFDMTRAEYIKALSPEEKAALEEYKKKNAAVAGDNAKIADLNKTMAEASADEAAGKGDEAVKLLQDLPTQRPTEPIVWAALGQAQLSAGDQAAKAAGARQPYKDAAITDKFAAAATSFQKAIEVAPNNKKLTPDVIAAYYLNLGQALAKSGKIPEAAAAYEQSATTAPAKAGTAYFNEAVIFYQAGGKNTEAAAAADKAIAADPKKADAYYIKGQALIPNATSDPKTGKFILPPGCLEAYQEYLELAPDGSHATEVKELLNGLGQPVKNSFKAGKK